MRHTFGCPDAVKNLGGCLISSWTEESENEVIYMVLVYLSFRFHDQNYECVWFFLIFLLIYCAVVIKFIAAPGSVMTSH